MKFAVGYQPPSNGEQFADIVADYRNSISELYFPWPGESSGRPPIMREKGLKQADAEYLLIRELTEIKKLGIGLDLLMNANCYGEKAVSRSFERQIISRLQRLKENDCLPDTVTTTSLFVARTVREYDPKIGVRASVNMRIGTVQAMGYVSDLFDSFYLQRDLQRDMETVRRVSAWCHARGKKLCMLVNSGCLRFCPGQTFHDNLIAHCAEIEKTANVSWNPHVCWNLYGNRANLAEILKATWIRPEDVGRYEGLVDVFKLATRQHSHPRTVIGSYAAGTYDGDLLELLEPGFAPAFYPAYIDNASFPPDWFEKSSSCRDGCTGCGYCESVLSAVLKRYPAVQ